MAYRITQCYLPPGSGDFPAFTPAGDGTLFIAPEGCKAELTWVLYNLSTSVTALCDESVNFVKSELF